MLTLLKKNAMKKCMIQEKKLFFKVIFLTVGWCPAGSVLPHGEKVLF